MKDPIFDLEQELMECRGVVDDIDLLYRYFGDDVFFTDMTGEHADKIMNLMGGLKDLYELKFDVMFRTFEKVCHEYHKRNNNEEVK